MGEARAQLRIAEEELHAAVMEDVHRPRYARAEAIALEALRELGHPSPEGRMERVKRLCVHLTKGAPASYPAALGLFERVALGLRARGAR